MKICDKHFRFWARSIMISILIFVSICFSTVVTSQAAEWKVGVAKTVITPESPIQLVGYGGRKAPFSGVDIDIYAKALAFEDAQGHRGIIVTCDLVGVQNIFFGPACQRVMKETGLSRAQIMLNASHNHTGPLMSLKPDLKGNIAYASLNEAEAFRIMDYTKSLQEKFYQLMIASLNDLQPATISWGTDHVDFPMNRRLKSPQGAIRMAPNPDGPVDRIVPVLKVTGENGKLRAILFGCACHNTGLTGDHNIISGDYAGYAQESLEKKYPGVVALFKAGCGADANPEPRTNISGVRKLGEELAEAVNRVLQSKMRPIHGELKFAYQMTALPLKKLNREQLAAYQGTVALMTTQMLRILDSGGTLPTEFSAPIAAWSFGNDLTIVAFPTETVSKYALNLRDKFPEEPLWVSGYNNDLFGYIPTAKIVREGGHETIGVTTWLWGTDLGNQVGLFSENVEEVMMNTASELIKKLKEKSPDS